MYSGPLASQPNVCFLLTQMNLKKNLFPATRKQEAAPVWKGALPDTQPSEEVSDSLPPSTADSSSADTHTSITHANERSFRSAWTKLRLGTAGAAGAASQCVCVWHPQVPGPA